MALFSIKTHCPNCFSEGAAEPECAYCGFDPRKAVSGSNYLAPFTRLSSGPYWVGCILGKPGGFGVVYAGWHEGLHKKVAIKEFFPSGAGFTERDQNQITVRPPTVANKTLNVGCDVFFAKPNY